MLKIYTKTGDAGETSLPGGRRVSKSCVEMKVIGELDELNAALGVALCHIGHSEESLSDFLKLIQRDLFKIGAELASLQTESGGREEKIGNEQIEAVEAQIDAWWAHLPELQNFILPGGGMAGAHLHMARTICRHAERELVAFGQTVKLRPELYKYLNRLSDFLFAAARWVNYQEDKREEKI